LYTSECSGDGTPAKGPADHPLTQGAVPRPLDETNVRPIFSSWETARFAAALRAPALVIHDRSDREVPFASGEAIARAWRGAELLATEGLGHSRILRDPATVDRATRFVLDRILAPELRDLDRWFDAIEERRTYERRAG
jgi:pimeloyl-ACP methyl ester carboxylesterase